MIDIEHNFYGRRDVLSLLGKRLQGLKEGYRQNVALVGPRTVGKTALLAKWMSEHDDPSVIMLYLDLESRDLNYFFRQFCKSMLYHYLKSEKLPLHEDLKLLCAASRQHVPATVAAIEAVGELIRSNKRAEAYVGLLSLLDVFTLETKKSIVLILDEFHHLSAFEIPEVYAELGRRIMTQKNCLYVLTSSYKTKAEEILAEKLSLLFGNFEILEIGVFDQTTSLQLMDRHLEEIKLGLGLKNFLADFSGGHPLYINIICQEMIALAGIYGQKEIYAPIMAGALENLLFNEWGVLSRHFELFINELCRGKSEGPLSALLIALAHDKHRVNELCDDLNLKPAQVNQRLNVLLSSEIAAKNGNYFYIKDKLFKYWIKYVYERRMRAIDLEPGKSRKLFKDEINKAVNEFTQVARKDLSTRIVDLLHKCGSEAFEIDGRRYKLSMFRDISPLKMRLGAGNFVEAVVANSDEGTWVIVLKKDPVLEAELSSFLEETKKMTPKPSRCVIVSLSGLDDNAKIRALQEKCWVWNEQEVNTLMQLYDEPYIVR